MSDPSTVDPSTVDSETVVEPEADLEPLLRAAIRDVADYPTPGIQFKDVTPLLADAALFERAVAGLALGFGAGGVAIDVVAGIEARGFIFGAPVALALGVGFVPIRKSGKLPFTTVSAEYALEYGSATIEIHTDSVDPGQRVLLLDDVLATGGTAEAAARLLEGLGAEVVAITFLLELGFLGGRERLAGRDVRSLVSY
jgi:adenine phosphoribosyltransferase